MKKKYDELDNELAKIPEEYVLSELYLDVCAHTTSKVPEKMEQVLKNLYQEEDYSHIKNCMFFMLEMSLHMKNDSLFIKLYQTAKKLFKDMKNPYFEEELSQKIYKEYSDKILVLENNIENKNKECDDLNETYNVKINLLNTQLDSKNDENKQLKNSLDEMNKKYNSEIVIYKAEIIGLKALNGEIKPSEDFTSEEEFTNLEESYLAFTEFFENQWKMTKKEIIKKIKKDLGVKKKNK